MTLQLFSSQWFSYPLRETSFPLLILLYFPWGLCGKRFLSWFPLRVTWLASLLCLQSLLFNTRRGAAPDLDTQLRWVSVSSQLLVGPFLPQGGTSPCRSWCQGLIWCLRVGGYGGPGSGWEEAMPVQPTEKGCVFHHTASSSSFQHPQEGTWWELRWWGSSQREGCSTIHPQHPLPFHPVCFPRCGTSSGPIPWWCSRF